MYRRPSSGRRLSPREFQMKTIKGMKALRLTFSRISVVSLVVAAFVPAALMLLTDQANLIFVPVWGFGIVYLALDDAIRGHDNCDDRSSLSMSIIHQVGNVAISLLATLVVFKVMRHLQAADATAASLASSCLVSSVSACIARLAYAAYKGVEFSESEMDGGGIGSPAEKTGG